MPSPVEALPCGSMSTTSVGAPTAASAVPRLIAVVVLPTPPFWLATTRTRGLWDMAKLPYLQDNTGRIGGAWMLEGLHPPRFTGLGQFSPQGLSLEKQANRAFVRQLLCIAKQLV